MNAGYNYSVISYQAWADFLANYGEPEVDYYVSYEQEQAWQDACDEWNAKMREYHATKSQVQASAQEVLNELHAMLEGLKNGEQNLAALSCEKRGDGTKKFCIDFWIERCMVDGVMGDCRGPDANAEINRSRMQIYVDPLTKDVEFTYNGTWKFSVSSCMQSFPNCGLTYVKDSATYMPPGSVRIGEQRSDGSFEVIVDARTSACPSYDLCPAINTRIWFIPDAGKSGGYRFGFDGNLSPSVSVNRMLSDNSWTMESYWREPAGKAAGAFILGLIDLFSRLQENVPRPDGHPPGCLEQ